VSVVTPRSLPSLLRARIVPATRSERGRLRWLLLLALLSASATVRSAAGAQSLTPTRPAAERLGGRITADSGRRPLAGVPVIVTMGPARLVRMDTTAADGTWTILFPEGTGDYLVFAAAPGYTSARRRMQRDSAGIAGDDGWGYRVDLTLTAVAPATLTTVRVAATRERPTRNREGEPGEPRGAAAEREVASLTGLVDPTAAGTLTALLETNPGSVTGRGGVGVLGQTEHGTTLGGLNVVGLTLPREANTTVRVAPTAYDPARGWFGGAQVDVSLAPGFQFAQRRLSLTGDLPALTATDRAGRLLGQAVTHVQLSAASEGTVADDRWTYNVAAQVGVRSQPLAAVDRWTAAQATTLGLDPTTLGAITTTAQQVGVPVSPRGDLADRRQRQLLLIGRLDRARFDFTTYRQRRATWGVTGYLGGRDADGVGTGPTATSSRSAQDESRSGGLQLEASRWVGPQDWLLEARSSLAYARDRTTALVDAPGALVLPEQHTDAVPQDVVWLGGNAGVSNARTTALWESQAVLRIVPARAFRHELSVTADARLDWQAVTLPTERRGVFTFASPTAFAEQRAQRFTQTGAAPTGQAQLWNGFLALGDRWRPTARLAMELGVRGEWTAKPAGIADATSAAAWQAVTGSPATRGRFAMRLLPRLGATYTRRAGDATIYGNRLGTFAVPAAQTLRGGIGAFTPLLGPGVYAGTRAANGIPSRVDCVGEAVPDVSWTGTLRDCRPDAPGRWQDDARAIQQVSGSWRPPLSWRANLAYQATTAGLAWTLEGIASRTRGLPSRQARNLRETPAFTLPGEGRPVFVQPDAISSAGALTTATARRVPTVGPVTEWVSDGRAHAWSITAAVQPATPLTSWLHLSGSYTLGGVREAARGLDGDTFGDPRGLTWAPGLLDVRHQVRAQVGVVRGRWSATAFLRAQSGLPYTFLVDQDVNGDGLANDRAFVVDPASATTPPALAEVMTRLLATADPRTRACLERAQGIPAARQGCRGPWSVFGNAQLQFTPRLGLGGRRTSFGLNFTNPVAGLDRLLHGPTTRGWGQLPDPDPVLYAVRGYDATTRTFAYQVNPRVGQSRGPDRLRGEPFRVTLDVKLELSPPAQRQQLDRWLKPGRKGRPGPRLSAADFERRYANNTPDPYLQTLRLADSLFLSRVQVESLTVMRTRFTDARRTIFAELAAYLAAMDDQWDADAAFARQEAAVNAGWALAWTAVQRDLRAVLTPGQRGLLPVALQRLDMMRTAPKNWRIYFAGTP